MDRDSESRGRVIRDLARRATRRNIHAVMLREPKSVRARPSRVTFMRLGIPQTAAIPRSAGDRAGVRPVETPLLMQIAGDLCADRS